ncbi:MAG TPA: dienelactone hydrolase family protein [Candidatus Angelobacter sp.]|nr:dienelactone hydrolase family protein [Candidatus Angelobacter sp.]
MPTFTSAGQPIRIDHYPPQQKTPSPAIILVHGSGGLLRGLDPFAGQAALFGVHVFVLHYFERTGHSWVYPSQIEQYFPAWLETLQDAVNFVSRQPGVDPNRIGLLGFSLGSYLSLALATQDSRIAAVAELFGGLAEHFLPNAGKLPPVLILHGGKDTVVPVDRAYELERVLQQHKIPYAMHIYPDQGHVFQGFSQFDAMRRVADFFRTHLKKAA